MVVQVDVGLGSLRPCVAVSKSQSVTPLIPTLDSVSRIRTQPPAMMAQADLTKIARIVAATALPWERWDIYQDIWMRFLRYNPRNRTGAWLMAYHARNDRYRDEAKRRHQDSEGAEAQAVAGRGEKQIEDIAGQMDDRAKLDELWAMVPIEMAILTGYVRRIEKGEKITGAEAARVFRIRKSLLKLISD